MCVGVFVGVGVYVCVCVGGEGESARVCWCGGKCACGKITVSNVGNKLDDSIPRFSIYQS